MKAKLLKRLRRDAEKRITIEYKNYEKINVRCTFIVRNDKKIVYSKYAISTYMKKEMKEDAFRLVNKLRRALIIEELKKKIEKK